MGDSALYRYLHLKLFLLGVLTLCAVGCPRRGPVTEVPLKGLPEGETGIVLKLEQNGDPTWVGDRRLPTLKIDGKDKPIKWDDTELTFKADPDSIGKTVTVVHNFWPVPWSNTIRTRKLKIE